MFGKIKQQLSNLQNDIKKQKTLIENNIQKEKTEISKLEFLEKRKTKIDSNLNAHLRQRIQGKESQISRHREKLKEFK